MAIYYIADTHFSHGNIVRICNRPFNSVAAMNGTMVFNWNERVKKDDIVYILGDFAYKDGSTALEILRKLNGRKILIVGNHDRKNLKNPAFAREFEDILPMLTIEDNGRRVVLCHYPMIEWDGYFREAYHVFGHIHNNTINNAFKQMSVLDRALNAGVDINNFMPVTLDELIVNNKKFNERYR